MNKIKYVSKSNSIKMPAHAGDAGYDLLTDHPILLRGGTIKKIKLDLKLQLPEGYYAEVSGKSGLADRGLFTIGNIIDNGYRGHIHVILVNPSKHFITFDRGDKIAQLIIHKLNVFELEKTTELKKTKRGKNGFGSTGK